MGQKTNPIGNRLGIIRGWSSSWFSSAGYGERIAEDYKIREYVYKELGKKASVSNVHIERTMDDSVMVYVEAAKPGLIIGKKGQDIDSFVVKLRKLLKKEVRMDVFEVKKVELDANLVAQNIAKNLEARVSFKRAVKMSLTQTIRAGAEGIKVQIAGRLNGVEMARTQTYKEGRIPLSTYRADVSYALAEAHTTYGRIGIKVWIMLGEVYGQRDLSLLVGLNKRKARTGGNSRFEGKGGRSGGRPKRNKK